MDTDFLEWTIFALNILYLLLAARSSIWCWSFGILASGLQAYLMLTGQLYSEFVLMLFYIVAGIYGRVHWGRLDKDRDNQVDPQEKKDIPITEMTLIQHVLFNLACIGGAFVLYYIVQLSVEAAYPMLDAFTTSYAIFTTWLVTRKVLSNWFYWITIDATTALLYFSKGWDILTLQMVIFTILAGYGYMQWQKKARV